MPFPKPTLALVPLVVLGACAGQTPDPPSLMPRAVERLSLEEPDVVQTVRPLPGAAMTARVETLLARVQSGVAAAGRLTPRGRTSAPTGSDAWIEAQTAVSAADVALLPAREALGEIEAAIADATAAGRDIVRLQAARDQAASLINDSQSRLDAVTPR